jgi:hypothetical protein
MIERLTKYLLVSPRWHRFMHLFGVHWSNGQISYALVTDGPALGNFAHFSTCTVCGRDITIANGWWVPTTPPRGLVQFPHE